MVLLFKTTWNYEDILRENKTWTKNNVALFNKKILSSNYIWNVFVSYFKYMRKKPKDKLYSIQ